MGQIFRPAANALARLTLMLIIFGIVGFLVFMDLMHRTAYGTEVDVPRQQPVPFSHKHHANMGIDCRYCHTAAEESAFAGIPPTRTCMNCHSLIWNDSPMLEPVRKSFETGKPLEWNRVHDLPQFAYFNHSIHLAKGIGCSTCHGRVDEMPLVRKVNTLYMGWCLNCHRAPEQFVRPRDKIFDMAYDPAADPTRDGLKLLEEYKIDTSNSRMLNCYYCHR